MNSIEAILEEREKNAAFNVPLWSALYHAYPALQDVPAVSLHERLSFIDKNILYLNESTHWINSLSCENGWQSPWWWFRARQFTIIEFERRGIIHPAPQILPTKSNVNRRFLRRKNFPIVRISKLRWLLALMEGGVRLGSASSYLSQSLLGSQQDDEIARHTFRPGSLAKIYMGDGVWLPLHGEIRLSISRTESDGVGSKARPYWLLSFSTELDARLTREFVNGEVEDGGYLVVYDVEKFHHRISEAADAVGLSCGTVEVDYYDEHFPPDWQEGQLHVIGLKPFRFAYQRELRIFLLPEEATKRLPEEPVYLQTTAMHDVAGVYNSRGEKVAGRGLKRLFSTL